jgi:glycosyltransferase involved in cell wall biosynthesis
MEQYDYSYWDVKYKKQGFRPFIPSLTTRVFPIENGFESTKWSVLSNYQERTFDVLAAFVIGADNRSILKGADLIIDIAQRNPDWKFKIIGSVDDAVEVPKNCVVIENCSQSELLYHYNDAKVFLQPSITEGFPNTLGEAMACGCYPIGSNVSAIPEIIGSFGLVLMSRNSLELERLVAQALMEIDSGQVNPNLISDSIFERFSIERRASKLLEAIDLVTSESSEFARISGSLPNTRRH